MTAWVAPGTLLLSVPQMLDPNFMHSVVLMIEHKPQGAFGLVLNQLADVDLLDLVEGHPILDGIAFPVFHGGPVGQDSLQFVHRLPEDLPGGVPLGEGLYLGGDLDELVAAMGCGVATPMDLRFFVGYSGWGEGQLEDELSGGSWVPAPPDSELVFDIDDRDVVWRRALRSLGDVGLDLSLQPPDVTWN
jgi:putative transcriptional regulator